MIKLKNLDCRIPKNYVLVKIIDDTNIATIGGINLNIGKTYLGDSYNEGLYSVRRGYLVKMPEKISYNEAGTPWKNSLRPNIGDVVYFDYLTARHSTHCTYENNIYYILPFKTLVLSSNSKMDSNAIQMLNGYVLAQNLPKKRISELEIKDAFYEDRFTVMKIGEPNKDYIDGLMDDVSIKVGDVVITRFRHYQELEPDYQLRLDGKRYVFFQRREVIAIL